MAAPWRQRLTSVLGCEPERRLQLAVFAPGVWRKRQRLTQLLGPNVSLQFGHLRKADAILGWGQKGLGLERAQAAALPYLAVEDSFLATLGGGAQPPELLGIVADPDGIYYDAREPSFCETLISKSADLTDTTSAEDLMALMRRNGLGKFNTLDEQRLRETPEPESFDAIVVDQIASDYSIPGGLATAQHFEQLLEAALDENVGGRVAVKLHPYDGVGGRKGHLREQAHRYNVEVLDNRHNWMRCAALAKRVYVVSSNAGLEALIAGASVSCFGVPFFSGWGLTDDRQRLERRIARPTLEQLVEAVYGQYGLSWLPPEDRQCAPVELAQYIAVSQRHVRDLADLTIAGVQRLKAGHVRAFSGSKSHPIRVNPDPAAPCPAVWASKASKDEQLRTLWEKRDRLFVEDGFIRSAGLGADLVSPLSLVFDRRGIYFDPSTTSDLEHLLMHYDMQPDEERRGLNLIRLLNDTSVTKYNQGKEASISAPDGKRIILVPGQVANDASVLRGTGDVRSNQALLEAVRAENPDAFIVYKPHPDVAEAGRPGYVPHADSLADIVLTGASAASAINAVEEVHTMTSLMGFEAILRKKQVTCYGLPFYAGWGLTRDLLDCSRRGRTRTIEQLVFLTLVAYPYYVSPVNRLPASPETVVRLLASGRPSPASSIRGARSILRLWRKLTTAHEYLKR